MASRRIAPSGACSVHDVEIEIDVIDETNTRVERSGAAGPARSATAISGWWRWSACSRTNIRARSILRGRSARRASRSRWAASTCRDACRCSTGKRGRARRLPRAGHLHVRGRGGGPVRSRAARRRGRPAQAALQLHERLAGHRGTPVPLSCRSDMSSARSGTIPASMPAAAVRTSARSAPSSTCRAASRATARPTMSSGWCA